MCYLFNIKCKKKGGGSLRGKLLSHFDVFYLQLCNEHDLRVRINLKTPLRWDLSYLNSENQFNYKVNRALT